ncbi:MAG TPA: hypothetical protein VLF60_03750 [Candidatus Saccharimonadales bacterium]|nr:hypothetical protein [Candidatus Saccharimonadales bacterium]
MKRRVWLGAGLLLGVVVLPLLFSRSASASPNWGPDPDFFTEGNLYGNSYTGAGRDVKFVVSQDPSTDITQTNIRIYLPSATGAITIDDYDICYNDTQKGTATNTYDQKFTLGSSSTAAVTFQLTNSSGGGAINKTGTWNGNTGCWDNTLTFNVSGSTKDANTGMYPYTLTVSALANGSFIDTFRVKAPTGGYISTNAAVDAASFGMQQSFPIPAGNNPLSTNPADPYKDYSIWGLPFGPDCSVTTSTVSNYVELYDDDNDGTNLDVQPQPFWVKLLEYDRSGNFLRYVYPDSVTWNSANHTSPTTNSSGGWQMVSSGGKRYEYVYTTASKKRIRLYYTFNRDDVYKFNLYEVYYDNTLQTALPYDGIYYYQACQKTSQMKAGMSASPATISPGGTTTFTPSITTSQYQGTFSATCTIVQNVYNPDGSQSSTSNPACTKNGNTNIPISANGTVTLDTNNYSAPTATSPGSKVCETITITSPSAPTYFASAADQTATYCVKIVGHPYFVVGGNDVWAGSSFDYSDNSCSGLAARASGISSWVTNGAGAVGEYGVLALGAITEVGSANQPGGNGLTFANSPSNGSLGAATHCIPDYYTTVGTSGAAWPGFASLPTSAGQKKYFATGPVTISAGTNTVPKGTQVALVVNGDVYIQGDIAYSGSYASLSDMSSLWIIAKGNIYIQETVKNLSGLYVAEGTSANPGIIQTCTKTGTTPPVTYNPLTANVCNTNGLDVYGAFLADKIYWQRTRGTAVSGQTYAESVQFDPGLYLTSPYSPALSTPQIQDTKELPPIY